MPKGNRTIKAFTAKYKSQIKELRGIGVEFPEVAKRLGVSEKFCRRLSGERGALKNWNGFYQKGWP